MPPWCQFYGSTMNADVSAVSGPRNRPASFSGSLTGPALPGLPGGPTGPAPFAGPTSLDRPASSLSEARLPQYIPLTPTASLSSTPSLSKRREPYPQPTSTKRKRGSATGSPKGNNRVNIHPRQRGLASQTTAQFPIEISRRDLPIQVSSFRPCHSTLSFYQAAPACVSFLRQQGVRLVIYLDDLLLMAETQELLQQQLHHIMSLLTKLGFLLNLKKCILTPCRQLEFLGFIVDSLTLSLYVPSDKVSKIKKECRHMLNKQRVSARNLAHIIGLLSSVTPAVLQAPLHYRGLQRLRSSALRLFNPKHPDYDITVPLS